MTMARVAKATTQNLYIRVEGNECRINFADVSTLSVMSTEDRHTNTLIPHEFAQQKSCTNKREIQRAQAYGHDKHKRTEGSRVNIWRLLVIA